MKNIFDAKPKNTGVEVFEQAEIFDQIVKTDTIKIERIISKGHVSPEGSWYDQDQNEWVLVLQGEAILLFDDDSTISLKTGDYIYIKAHQKHRVKWTDPAIETIWLAVHF